jgi:Ca2+-binding EF-hand superfamily protein
LSRQHHALSVGDANVALQTYFEKLKPDLQNLDAASFYTLLSGSVVPAILHQPWSYKDKKGLDLHGHIANDYFEVVGGLVLTAVKGPVDKCFHGQPCFSSEALTDPFYDMKLPGEAHLEDQADKMMGEDDDETSKRSVSEDNEDEPDFFLQTRRNIDDDNAQAAEIARFNQTYKVPYNSHFGGYSVSIPSSTTEENMKTLLAAYRGLFGRDTREIWVHTVLFNPSGQKTVTFLEFGCRISLHSQLSVVTRMNTIPYFLSWSTLNWILGFFCVYCGCSNFWRPIHCYWFCAPKRGMLAHHNGLHHVQDVVIAAMQEDERSQFRKKWLRWLEVWRKLPARGGRPLWFVPTLLWLAMLGSAILWCHVIFLYRNVNAFENDSLFLDPVAHYGRSMPEMIEAALHAAHDRMIPLMLVVKSVTLAYNHYFLSAGVVVTLMVLRLQQFFAFQKRLSMVVDTFNGIGDDLLHMSIVLVIVCFLFGVIDSLAFGAYDPAFQHFALSGWEMFLVCFGMFRPSATSPVESSLFKYTPHVGFGDESLYWMPLILQIIFRTLVVLLLFKLLMGVIMESYKKHSKYRESAPTLREDLVELGIAAYHYIWRHKIRRQPWVPFFHVALSIARHRDAKQYQWSKFFVGLEYKKAVAACLNSVFEDDVEPRIKAQIQHARLKECRSPEIEYVLKVYGMDRQRAEVLFAKRWVEAKEAHSQKKQRKDSVNEDEEEADYQVDRLGNAALEEVLTQLYQSGCEEDERSNVQLALKVMHTQECKKQVFTKEKLTGIFAEYDIESIGLVDHRVMPELFIELGFNVSDNVLTNILADYDENEDGDTSLKELLQIVYDDRLIGLWHLPSEGKMADMLSKDMKSSAKAANVQKYAEYWKSKMQAQTNLKGSEAPSINVDEIKEIRGTRIEPQHGDADVNDKYGAISLTTVDKTTELKSKRIESQNGHAGVYEKHVAVTPLRAPRSPSVISPLRTPRSNLDQEVRLIEA